MQMALPEISAQEIEVAAVSLACYRVLEVSTFCKFSLVRGILVPGGMSGLGSANLGDGPCPMRA